MHKNDHNKIEKQKKSQMENDAYFESKVRDVLTILLWNQTYSLGPMFMDCQNFACSWECNFVGNWFEASQCKAIHFFIKRSWGRKFVGKGDPRIPRTSIPHEQQRFLIILRI